MCGLSAPFQRGAFPKTILSQQSLRRTIIRLSRDASSGILFGVKRQNAACEFPNLAIAPEKLVVWRNVFCRLNRHFWRPKKSDSAALFALIPTRKLVNNVIKSGNGEIIRN
jgi:hypothetical protein